MAKFSMDCHVGVETIRQVLMFRRTKLNDTVLFCLKISDSWTFCIFFHLNMV